MFGDKYIITEHQIAKAHSSTVEVYKSDLCTSHLLVNKHPWLLSADVISDVFGLCNEIFGS